MMGQMVWLKYSIRLVYPITGVPSGLISYPECSTVGDTNGQVGEDCERPVGNWSFEGKVVRYFMYGKEEILIRCGADNIDNEKEAPG